MAPVFYRSLFYIVKYSYAVYSIVDSNAITVAEIVVQA